MLKIHDAECPECGRPPTKVLEHAAAWRPLLPMEDGGFNDEDCPSEILWDEIEVDVNQDDEAEVQCELGHGWLTQVEIY